MAKDIRNIGAAVRTRLPQFAKPSGWRESSDLTKCSN